MTQYIIGGDFLKKDKGAVVKPDSYIINFYIVNQNTSEGFYKWYSFQSIEELLGFIKFVVLPSGCYSRIFGEEGDEVIITADSYDGVVELLNSNTIRVDENLINNFKEDYSIIEDMEREFSFELLKKFCNSLNAHLDYKGIVFSGIDVYENIKELGKQLVNDYEEQDMIDELERQMEMSKEDIIGLFSNIETNAFMLNKINEFLSSKFLL